MDATVHFGKVVFDAGSEGYGYLSLENAGDEAVDISGWQVTRDVEYTFPPGSVIVSGGRLYVSSDVAAFRSGPMGNAGRFVLGNYRGRLSSTWGILKLYTEDGRLVATKAIYPLSD
jgi:hypothetical protein